MTKEQLKQYFSKNKGKVIIGIFDRTHGAYSIGVCSMKDKDGITCGRYCNVSCTHWTRSEGIEPLSNEEIAEIERCGYND
jgi:hypothetical protein